MDSETLAKIFESGMLICFGTAWPLSIIKLLRSKTSAGKSFFFLYVIFCGYLSGILFKIYKGIDEIIILYVFNLLMVGIDIFLSYRYRKKPDTK